MRRESILLIISMFSLSAILAINYLNYVKTLNIRGTKAKIHPNVIIEKINDSTVLLKGKGNVTLKDGNTTIIIPYGNKTYFLQVTGEHKFFPRGIVKMGNDTIYYVAEGAYVGPNYVTFEVNGTAIVKFG